MYCPNCKKQLADTVKFCVYCGTSVHNAQEKTANAQNGMLSSNVIHQENEALVSRNMKKRNWMIPLIAVVALIAIGAGILFLHSPAPAENSVEWQSQYDLGVRYLNAGEYEKAIVAFETALEIDPKVADTYTSLADTYLSVDDRDKAMEIIDLGVANTDDDELKRVQVCFTEISPSEHPGSVSEVLDSINTSTNAKSMPQPATDVQNEVTLENPPSGTAEQVSQNAETTPPVSSDNISAHDNSLIPTEEGLITDGDSEESIIPAEEELVTDGSSDEWLLVKMVTTYPDQSKTSVTEYKYDDDANLVSEIQNDGDSEIKYDYTYDYDKKDNIARISIYEDEIKRTTEHYNEDGSIKAIEYFGVDSELQAGTDYSYDDSGKLISVENYAVDSNGDKRPSPESMCYSYDEEGLLIEEMSLDLDGQPDPDSAYTKYTYDDGRLTEENGFFGDNEFSKQYSYDSHDRLILEKAHDNMAGDSITRYEYDENDNLVKETTEGDAVNCVIEYIYIKPADIEEYQNESLQNTAEPTPATPEAKPTEMPTVETEPPMTDPITFADLPETFLFTSGAGGWGTMITLENDGTFTGNYHDSEMGVTGDDYPYGTVYICEFEGRFTDLTRIDDYTYSMRLEELNTYGEPGEEYIEDGILYIESDPYGFEDALEFLVYLPGKSISDMDDGFLMWAYMYIDDADKLPDGVYGIYNIGGEEGFVSQ